MSNIFCSDNFRTFFKELTSVNYDCIDDMNLQMKKSIKILVDDMNIGQLTCVHMLPKSAKVPEAKHELMVYYTNGTGFEDECFEKNYATGEGGFVTITINPKTDVSWSDEELEEIEFLSDVIFTLNSKTRLVEKVKHFSMIFDTHMKH